LINRHNAKPANMAAVNIAKSEAANIAAMYAGE
jgi:hypothetical protein